MTFSHSTAFVSGMVAVQKRPSDPDRGRRVREIRQSMGISQGELARRLGVKPGAVGNWEQGQGISYEMAKALAALVYTPAEWILDGSGIPPDFTFVSVKRGDVDDFTHSANDESMGDGAAAQAEEGGIVEIDVRAGMGNGGHADVEVRRHGNHADPIKDERWHFPPSFVRHELRAPVARIVVLETDGDSMFPTISAGERVIVDTGHRKPSPDGIYAIRDRFGFMQVKRLQAARTGDPPTVQIISDNKSHPIETVGIDEIEIVGKVLYGLKRY